jgi:hypothetical protein
VDRIAIVAHLKDGVEPRARELLEGGPPFSPRERGLSGHAVYLSASEVVFVFEGDEVEWRVDDLVNEPFQWPLAAAFDRWRELVEGPPRIARAVYAWHADAGADQQRT